MERDIKEGIKKVVDEYITNRKAMFIPIAAVASFMLVGYAAADKEKPEIISNQIDLVYGEEFDVNSIDISDNKDSRDDILVSVDTASLDVDQLGSYDVKVSATDAASNEATKTVTVNVVDIEAPKIEALGSSQGYVIEVPINGSTDFASYVKATDNVDGEVTPFIKASEPLNTAVKGQQDITLTVDDASGNETEETFTFVVSDLEAPVINLTQGDTVTVDYGSAFDLNAYVNVTDNVDGVMTPNVEGGVDTLKLDETQPLKLSVTDSSGNVSEATLNVVVKDLSAPVISLSQSEITVNAGDSVDFSSYISSAIDNKDGDVRGNVQIAAPSTSSSGTKTATYSVTDAAGNTGTASLTVKVNKKVSSSGNKYSGSAPSNNYGNSVLSAAYSRLGCPYKWGAEGPNAFDCSGFVKWCYAQVGVSLPHSSSALKSAGTQISISNAQPGDILWKSGHVGIYIGNGQYIHAPQTGDVVKISSVSSSGFVCAIRVK
ncbi:C40 family peptidase [uncultured Thomasclavelia sp.]|uniref:C40 family peptidase n=1 Tax=uncultured Thomasclavelia sp. TaxID=3025759 RepID=UPI0025F6A9C8|nr:NlpC/P60 family protein [uncultured Thomasclavelia sp.]